MNNNEPRSRRFWTLTGIAAVVTAVGALIGSLYAAGVIGGGSIEEVERTLTIEVSGQGTTSPSPGSHTYDDEEVVTVIATPSGDYSFDQWEGDTSGSSTTVRITMDRDKRIIACFAEPTTPELLRVPTVGNVPRGWYLSNDQSYGTYESEDGHMWGLFEYIDEEDGDTVRIYYGDVPSGLGEKDESALIARAVFEATFEPQDTGAMLVAGQLAGWAQAYKEDIECWALSIVFVKGSVCINIYTLYDATEEDYTQVMSLINSIDV